MDEPLSNLDAKLRVQMRAELKRFHQDINATIIYVTHDQLEAVTMADKMAVMNGGFLQQYDAPDIVYHHPVNTFVAGFVGSPAMNLMRAKVDPRGRGDSLTSPAMAGLFRSSTRRPHGYAGAPPMRSLGCATTRSSCTDRRRREQCRPPSIPLNQPATSPSCTPDSATSMIVFSVAPDQLAADDKIYLEFDQKQMHLFDGATEQALPSA